MFSRELCLYSGSLDPDAMNISYALIFAPLYLSCLNFFCMFTALDQLSKGRLNRNIYVLSSFSLLLYLICLNFFSMCIALHQLSVGRLNRKLFVICEYGFYTGSWKVVHEPLNVLLMRLSKL